MSYVLAFYGVKDGQGLTTTALGVAGELARQHSVLFVDADMSGTGTAADSLQVDPAGRGMHNLLGSGQITSRDLVAQAVPTTSRNLGLVPGLAAVCGSSPTRLVERLREGGALSMPSVELIVLDLGSIAHPDQRSLRQAAAAIATVAHRVFTVIKDDPPVLARAVQVLRAAAPPKTEVLVVEHRRGALRKHVEQVLQLRVPEVAIGPPIAWDPNRARAALDAGRPLELGALVRQLQLLERAQPVLAAVRTATDAAGAEAC
jgi:MinD-like ATPase involved in chromosome partitioning or flagellar assembly